jgi:hypothetical protein
MTNLEAKQEFVDRLRKFSDAARALQQAWQRVDDTGPGGDFAASYPFQQSFDELIAAIMEWRSVSEEDVERQR